MNLKHIYILSVFILLTFVRISAQPIEITNYSFLNTSADTLTFYGQSQSQFASLSQKFSQMIRLGNRQINILHIGDSHLQADLYTGQVRKNFQSFTDGLDGTRGMVTPFLKGSPDSYKISFSSSWQSTNILSSLKKDNLGLWGTTAYTNALKSSINISVNNKNPIKYDFNKLRIYHSKIKDNDNISISDIETAYQKISNKKEGYTEFFFADYISDIKINITKSNSETFYIYGFYFDNDNPGVVYNVTGTNGATAMSYLNANLLQQELSTLELDMIIISLGTNDTYEPDSENSFEDNLSLLVKQIQNTKSNIPILLITPTECYYHRKKINPRQEKTVEIINNVAKKTGCIYLDMYNVLGGKGSCEKMYAKSLMQADKVHLTAKGYQLEGDLLYNALWNSIEKNF